MTYERARRSQLAYLFFSGKDFQEQAVVFGDDRYPIGLRTMDKNVERAIRGSLEQGAQWAPTLPCLPSAMSPTSAASTGTMSGWPSSPGP